VLDRYLATDQARRSAQIALIAEVAIQFLTERELDEQLVVARETLEAVKASYELNQHSFDNGVDSYLTVLSAQQDLYHSQQSLIQARAERLANLISLYKALGGGWNEHTVGMAPGSAAARSH